MVALIAKKPAMAKMMTTLAKPQNGEISNAGPDPAERRSRQQNSDYQSKEVLRA